MRKLLLIVSWLICALALCSCAANGPVVKPAVCPTLPPAPAPLMRPSNAGQKVRAELFEPPTSATRK